MDQITLMLQHVVVVATVFALVDAVAVVVAVFTFKHLLLGSCNIQFACYNSI